MPEGDTLWNHANTLRPVLVGQPVTPQLAHAAGEAAVAEATPLSENAYKVRLAQTSVKRALLKATNQLEGGL